MKRTITLALAGALFATGGAAMAQDASARGTDLTRADAETRAAERFARLDVNGDGRLDAADREARAGERAANREERARERFASADADGNGQLTFEEMTSAREEARERHAERRAERGEQHGERAGMRGRRALRGGPGALRGMRGMRAMMSSQADTDNDGAISRAEFDAATAARFAQADSNGDGTVTAAERRERHGEMRERRMERRSARQ